MSGVKHLTSSVGSSSSSSPPLRSTLMAARRRRCGTPALTSQPDRLACMQQALILADLKGREGMNFHCLYENRFLLWYLPVLRILGGLFFINFFGIKLFL